MAPAPVKLTIERMAVTGEGVATSGGRAVFVSGAFMGEVVMAQVSEQGSVLRGELQMVTRPSAARREAPCALADRCGGCDWLAISEAEQRRLKELLTRDTLKRLGGIELEDSVWKPTVFSADGMGTRRRATFHVRKKRLAFFGRRSHETVEIASCPALTRALQNLPGPLSDALKPMLKDVEDVQLLESNGVVAIAVTLKDAVRATHREVASSASMRKLGLAGVVLVPPSGKGGPELVGKPVLEDGAWLLRPDAFAQAHGELNKQLVSAVNDALEAKARNVLELYCGNGNFTLPIAKSARQVTAVESAGVSLALGQQAASRAGLENVRWIQGDAEKTALALAREGLRFERLLLDPPRTGCLKLAECATALEAKRVVYVACDASALARDAKRLISGGYRVESAQLFDMFPQTHHVETVMAFVR